MALQDVRYAFRGLRRTPGFTLTAILTLALGIGANVAIFSVVYAVLLKPLPYRDPGRLVVVRADVTYAGAHRRVPLSIQPGEFDAWQRPLNAIESSAFYATDVQAMSGTNGSEVLDSAVVSGSFFATLGGPVVRGRVLDMADDLTPSAVISERLARRLFNRTEDAIGRTLMLTARAHTIVGVVSRAFQFPSGATDVWLPAGFVRSVNPRCCGFHLIARVSGDAPLEHARSAAHAVFQSSAGATRQSDGGLHTRVVRLQDEISAATRPALLMLLASVSIVLLIACSNLIHLVLARNAAREREFAIRRAIGATRSRLMRQLIVESAMLAGVGTAIGLAFAGPAVIAVVRLAGDAVPRADAIRIGVPVLLFAAALAVLATIVTGLIPARRAVNAADASTRGPGGAVPPGHARRLHRALCTGQVALAIVLLVCATLLSRSLIRLLNTDLGVSTEHVVTASLNLGFGQRPTDAQTLTRIGRVLERIRTMPGVQAAGVGTSLPPNLSRIRVTLRRHGDVVDYQAAAVPATPGYFEALRMRLVKGRFFTDVDDAHHPQVMIMSQDTARRVFGEGDPIGRTMLLPALRDGRNTSVEMTLVGIIANVKYSGLALPADDAVYRPFAQQSWVAPFLVVRTIGTHEAFLAGLQRQIATVDPGIVTSSVMTLDRLIANDAALPRFRTVLLASLAGLALVIATVGLYGVVAYTVSQRIKEIGVRIALGATANRVLVMVLSDGLIIALGGIGLGVIGALALTRLLAGLLYGVTPGDPVSFVLASATLLGLTLIASYVPARRATHVDPMVVLRSE